MFAWFRRHEAARKVLFYLGVAALLAITTRELRTSVVITLALVLFADDWTLTVLPPTWDRERARGAVRWVTVGLLVGFGVTVPLWFGFLPLLLAIVVVVGARADLWASADVGVFLGPAAWSAVVAWASDVDSGRVCVFSGYGQECTTDLSARSLVFAAVALALVAGVVQARRVRRLRAHALTA